MAIISSKHSMKYRPDVDGLRAIAVLLVIADHMGTRFTGGYIGVDIFFVISGYLISSLILSELAENRFSVVRFYERRVRRIFPALLVMLLVTTVLTYQLFVPSELVSYAQSLLGALFSCSNFVFWHESGYFAGASAVKPLLHTWSLAVEEQFYILFPLFLVLVRRFFPHKLKLAIIGIALLSLVAAIFTVAHDPVAAFFFAPLRAWELLIGAIISQRYVPDIRGALARNVASAGGALLILIPAIRFDESTPFPGLAAIPPCLGAAFIIAAGETGTSLVGRVLSWRPVVFIGLISYSLYLWHWPLLVFQRTNSLLDFPPGWSLHKTELATFAIMIVIATLSWALIERPFRTGRFRPERGNVFLVNGAALAAIAIVGIVFIVARGLPNRFPPDAQKVAQYMNYDRTAPYREGTCFLNWSNRFSDLQVDQCLGQQSGKPTILIAGDSHAAQLWSGLAAAYPERDLLEVAVAGCVPTVNDPRQKNLLCRQFSSFLYGDYLAHHRVGVLLLAARWQQSDMAVLTQTIDFARTHQIQVVVVGPNIEYDQALPRLLAISLRDGRPEELDHHRATEFEALDRSMADLALNSWHVPYISIYRDLCSPSCPIYAKPGVPLLFDSNHFTSEGSLMLAEAIKTQKQIP